MVYGIVFNHNIQYFPKLLSLIVSSFNLKQSLIYWCMAVAQERKIS